MTMYDEDGNAVDDDICNDIRFTHTHARTLRVDKIK